MLQVESIGGQGPELVLLHGWGSTAQVWQPLLPLLQLHFRLTLVTLPQALTTAEGSADVPEKVPEEVSAVASADQLARRLLQQALPQLPSRAIWLGWSLGGQLALLMAQQHPQRVSGLVLVASNPCFVQRDDWSCAMDQGLFEQFEQSLAADRDKTLQRFILLMVRGSEQARRERLQLSAALADADAPTLLQLLQLLQLDMRSALAELAVPSLLMLGQHDLLVPTALADAASALRPDTQILIQADTAHAPFLSHPEHFTQQVVQWAQQISA